MNNITKIVILSSLLCSSALAQENTDNYRKNNKKTKTETLSNSESNQLKDRMPPRPRMEGDNGNNDRMPPRPRMENDNSNNDRMPPRPRMENDGNFSKEKNLNNEKHQEIREKRQENRREIREIRQENRQEIQQIKRNNSNKN